MASPTHTFLDQIAWNDQGLAPAVAQDAVSGEVLMMAWMNRESLAHSVAEGRAVYWSRSRQKLWRKGEESGHVQHIREIRLDCDGDTILIKVEQVGDIACHTGRKSCFYNVLIDAEWRAQDPVLKDPNRIYGHKDGGKS